MPKPVNKRLHNVIFDFEDPLTKPKLDKNLLKRSQRQLYQYKIAPIAKGFTWQ